MAVNKLAEALARDNRILSQEIEQLRAELRQRPFKIGDRVRIKDLTKTHYGTGTINGAVYYVKWPVGTFSHDIDDIELEPEESGKK